MQNKTIAKLHISHPDDGSTLFEWIGENWRFGLSFEMDRDESEWFYVGPGGQASGPLPVEALYDALLKAGKVAPARPWYVRLWRWLPGRNDA